MIRLSKLADYAVVTLGALPTASGNRLMKAADLAQATNLPEPTVAKVLKLLARGGIVTSVRGAAGGYKLARARADIRIVDIITAVDGPIALTDCVDGRHEGCTHEDTCSMKGRWDGVNAAVVAALENMSLAEMINNNSYAEKRSGGAQ